MRDRSQLGWLSNLEKTLFEISSIYSLVGVCKLRNLTSSILIRLMHLIETLYVVEPPPTSTLALEIFVGCQQK